MRLCNKEVYNNLIWILFDRGFPKRNIGRQALFVTGFYQLTFAAWDECPLDPIDVFDNLFSG